jgi:plastocyanin
MFRLKSILAVMLSAFFAMVILAGPAGAVVHQVNIEDFFFTPTNIHVNVGDSVRWTNNGTAPHTSTSDDAIWSSGTLAHGQSFVFRFMNSGIFPYHCAIHLSMRDTIRVDATSIGDEPSAPNKFELSQNYPNPFNAQTTISFNLPNQAHVRIQIYDVLGRQISTLLDEDRPAGDNEVIWDAENATSGIYFYKIQTNNLTDTKRMVLLK